LNAIKEEISRERNDFYKKNNINVLLSHEESNNIEFKKTIEEINKINGGFLGYEKLVRILKDDGNENDQKAMQIKGIIE